MPTIDRPNILLIDCADLGADGLVAAGAGSALQRLADAGKALTCQTANPMSGPARATLMTGRWPQAHGLWTNETFLPLRERLLSERLAAAGYFCGLIGRNHLAPVNGWRTEARRDDDGYRLWEWAHSPTHRARQNAWMAWLKKTAPDVHQDLFGRYGDPDATAPDHELLDKLARLSPGLSFNAWVADRAAAFLDMPRGRGQPWFLVAGLQMERFLDPQSALRRLDDSLGRILNALDERGMTGDTLVVLTSNGVEGQHLTPSGTGVPLILRWPGHPVPAADRAMPVDIAPTLCAAAGLPPCRRHQGRALFGTTDQPRDFAITIRRGAADAGMPDVSVYREGPWWLALDHSTGATALYDVANDPELLADLASMPEQAGRVERMMDRMMDCLIACEDRSQPRLGGF